MAADGMVDGHFSIRAVAIEVAAWPAASRTVMAVDDWVDRARSSWVSADRRDRGLRGSQGSSRPGARWSRGLEGEEGSLCSGVEARQSERGPSGQHSCRKHPRISSSFISPRFLLPHPIDSIA